MGLHVTKRMQKMMKATIIEKSLMALGTMKPRMAQEITATWEKGSWQVKHHSQLLASDLATPTNLVAVWEATPILNSYRVTHREADTSGTAYQNWSNEQSPSGMEFLSLTLSISYLFSF